MATIVTQTADNADHIQYAFRRLDRDDFPLGVYQAIYDYINDIRGEYDLYHLDVIAWCCDLREATLDDPDYRDIVDAIRDDHDDRDDRDDLSDLSDLDVLTDYLRSATTVLYVDEDAEVIYYLAYYS